MRIRSTKPEFWKSRTIAALDWDVRLVLKGLESYVDDNGVGKDDIALIASDVFPRDLVARPRETLARLSEAISTLADHGLVVRYEADGDDLLYIDRWKKQQRIDKPANGRFPRPDGTLDYRDEVNRECYAKPRETVARAPEVVAPGTGEQGNRGTGEQSLLSDESDDGDDDRFNEFWDAYDKKVGRKKAEQKWKLALRRSGIDADLLIDAAHTYVRFQKREGKHPEFTKDPATWLNGEHWNDERATERPAEANRPVQSLPMPPPEIANDAEKRRQWYADRKTERRGA